MKSAINVIAIAFLALAGCAGGERPVPSSQLVVAQDAALPSPSRADQTSAIRSYLVGPLDKLQVDVYALDNLSREVQVDGNGQISLPIAGVIDANGHTPAEIAKTIADKLRDAYVRDPQVSVNLREVASQVVTVDGEVKEPGLYPVGGNMTLMRAIATAKGTTEFARTENVIVLRTVGTQRMAGVYNLASIRAGKYGDPALFANDVVLVGESAGRRIFRDLIQLSPAVLTPLVYLLR